MAGKEYRIAPYTETSYGMFESDDFRLRDRESYPGTFKRDQGVKGLVNGYEIGIFLTDTQERYLVFTDHSAKRME